MADTTNLILPLMSAAQSQKHLTHNDALIKLDTIVQLSVKSAALTAPPVSPTAGDRYIVGSGATGAWSGKDLNVTAFLNGVWTFFPPRKGWFAYNEADSNLLVWSGSAWGTGGFVTPATLNNNSLPGRLTMLGIGGATPDSTNRLSANTPAVLLNHAGSSLSVTMNKNAVGNDASLTFQDGFSSRALMGLLGDDDFTLKVSPDGSSFTEALKVDKTSGSVKLQGMRHRTGTDMFGFLPVIYTMTGSGQVEIYRNAGPSGAFPRTTTIASVTSAIITLSGFNAGDFYHDGMENVAYIRIWNTSKSPMQPAWVNKKPAGNQLKVVDPASIASWTGGDTIQVGDTGTPAAPYLAVAAFDISPILIANFGVAFRQSGVVLSANNIAGNPGDGFAYTPTGALGSAITMGGLVQVSGVSPPVGSLVSSCSVLSPISNSNLLMLREIIATTSNDRLVRLSGVFA